MRIVELTSGVQTMLSGEESELLDKLGEFVLKTELTERENLIAQNLIRKDAIKRVKQDGAIGYITK